VGLVGSGSEDQVVGGWGGNWGLSPISGELGWGFSGRLLQAESTLGAWSDSASFFFKLLKASGF
jgi:hypothetical protein